MKLSTLLELIGSGWILLVAGASLFGMGVSYGLYEALHLPLWACLCGMGLFVGVIGFVFVDRGNEEAEEQVKKIPMMINVLKSPWLKIGGAIVGGILLERLTSRGRRDIIIEKTSVMPPVDSARGYEAAQSADAPSAAGAPSGVSHYVGEQLKTLASMAGGMALSLGMQTLGIPSIEELLNDLMGTGKNEENQETNGAAPSSSAPKPGRVPVKTASSRPSYNGSNSAEDYDPTM